VSAGYISSGVRDVRMTANPRARHGTKGFKMTQPKGDRGYRTEHHPGGGFHPDHGLDATFAGFGCCCGQELGFGQGVSVGFFREAMLAGFEGLRLRRRLAMTQLIFEHARARGDYSHRCHGRNEQNQEKQRRHPASRDVMERTHEEGPGYGQ
jgi:hypothetical protein